MRIFILFSTLCLAKNLPGVSNFYSQQLKLYQNMTGISDEKVEQIIKERKRDDLPKFLVETNHPYEDCKCDMQIYFEKEY